MTDHVLDRPAWFALTTRHAHLSRGDALAKRYDPALVPFVSSRDDRPESLASLADLLGAGPGVILQAQEIRLPEGVVAASMAVGVQMVAGTEMPEVDDERIEALTIADAGEMLALATLTKPGPFTLRAQSLGRFWGIKEDGRLAAMAGERMSLTGYTEVSGVCTHPDFRGRGYARLLSACVSRQIAKRGDVPYLHAYKDNTAAVGLYASLGFTHRTDMHFALIQRV